MKSGEVGLVYFFLHFENDEVSMPHPVNYRFGRAHNEAENFSNEKWRVVVSVTNFLNRKQIEVFVVIFEM